MRSVVARAPSPEPDQLTGPEFAQRVAELAVTEFIRRGVTTPEYLNTNQSAVYLGVSRQWLEIARCKGGGPPYIKLSDAPGGAVRYRRADLDSFMAERRVGGAI